MICSEVPKINLQSRVKWCFLNHPVYAEGNSKTINNTFTFDPGIALIYHQTTLHYTIRTASTVQICVLFRMYRQNSKIVYEDGKLVLEIVSFLYLLSRLPLSWGINSPNSDLTLPLEFGRMLSHSKIIDAKICCFRLK